MGFAEGFCVGYEEGGIAPSISRISGTGFVVGFAEGFCVGYEEGGIAPSTSRISGTGFVVGSFIVWVRSVLLAS